MRDRSSFLVRLQQAYPIKAPQGRTTNDALLKRFELTTPMFPPSRLNVINTLKLRTAKSLSSV